MAKVVQQPMEEKPWTDWDTHICDCFEDAGACCYGFWCCPCMSCSVSRRFGENSCLPLCDMCSFGVLTICEIPLFVPPAVLSLRAAMRNRYQIKGSLCKDIVVSCFCTWCAWCQMYRELKHRKKDPTTIINMTQTTVNVQPAPVMTIQQFEAQSVPLGQPGVVMAPH